MFLSSTKNTFSSLTFAFLLSANLFISSQSFAGPKEDYQEGVALFEAATPKNEPANLEGIRNAIVRFSLAFEGFGANTREQAYSLLYKARSAKSLENDDDSAHRLVDYGATNPIALFQQAVDLFRNAEKEEVLKYGLADALYYQAEEMLSRSKGQDDLRKAAKATYDEAFRLVQNPKQKIRVGEKLADMCIEDSQARGNAQNREALRDQARQYRIDYLPFITDANDKTIAHTQIAKLFSEIRGRETHNLEKVIEHAFAARELIKTLGTEASERQKADLNELLQRTEFTMGKYDGNRIIKYATQYLDYCTALLDSDSTDKKRYARSYAFAAMNLANAYMSRAELNKAEEILDQISDRLPQIASLFSEDMNQSIISVEKVSEILNPDLRIRVEHTLSKIRLHILKGTPRGADNDILALDTLESELSQSDFNKLRTKSLKIRSELALANHSKFKESETINQLISNWETFGEEKLSKIREDRAWKFASDFFEYYYNLGELKAYKAKVHECNQNPEDLKENMDAFKAKKLSNWKEVAEFYKKAIEIAGKSGFYDKERSAQIKLRNALEAEINCYTNDGLAPTNIALETLKSNLRALTTFRSYGFTRTKTTFSESEAASKAELEEQIAAIEKEITKAKTARQKADQRIDRLDYACGLKQPGYWGQAFDPFNLDQFEPFSTPASNESSSSSSSSLNDDAESRSSDEASSILEEQQA